MGVPMAHKGPPRVPTRGVPKRSKNHQKRPNASKTPPGANRRDVSGYPRSPKTPPPGVNRWGIRGCPKPKNISFSVPIGRARLGKHIQKCSFSPKPTGSVPFWKHQMSKKDHPSGTTRTGAVRCQIPQGQPPVLTRGECGCPNTNIPPGANRGVRWESQFSFFLSGTNGWCVAGAQITKKCPPPSQPEMCIGVHKSPKHPPPGVNRRGTQGCLQYPENTSPHGSKGWVRQVFQKTQKCSPVNRRAAKGSTRSEKNPPPPGPPGGVW